MTWRTSSYSADDGNCVQLRGDLTAIRDSKNTDGPVLTFRDTRVLTEWVKSTTAGSPTRN